jgi:hypothetical protein
MSWKDRAEPVGKKAEGGWRSRALPAEAAAKPEASTSVGETIRDQAANVMSLGYLPQLRALGSKAVDTVLDPTMKLDADLRKQGFKLDENDPTYLEIRDAELKKLAAQEAEHPVAAKVGMGLGVIGGAAIPVGAAARGLNVWAQAAKGAKTGAIMGALANPGDKENEIDPIQVEARGQNALIGGGIGAAVPLAAQGGSSLAQKLKEALRGKADKLAEKATGATGIEVGKFVPGTGRELLDRGVVKFSSSPSGIAKNAQKILDAAEASKSDILESKLKGVSVDRNKIYAKVREKIKELSSDESQTDLVRKLESKLDDLLDVAHRNKSELPISQSEGIRRGFDKSAKWDSASDLPSREANRILANAYREVAEETASTASPNLGAQFKADKKTQHLLIPVVKAAEKRANQLQQSPAGGLLDMAAASAGGTVAGPAGALSGLAIKQIRPRLASMGAVSSDKLAQSAGKLSNQLKDMNPKEAAAAIIRAATSSRNEFTVEDNPIINNKELMKLIKEDPSLIDVIADKDTKVKVMRLLGIKNQNRSPTSGSAFERRLKSR